MAAIVTDRLVMPKDGDEPGSPYLRRRLRSYEEVKRKHAERRRDRSESSKHSESQDGPDEAKGDGPADH